MAVVSASAFFSPPDLGLIPIPRFVALPLAPPIPSDGRPRRTQLPVMRMRMIAIELTPPLSCAADPPGAAEWSDSSDPTRSPPRVITSPPDCCSLASRPSEPSCRVVVVSVEPVADPCA